MKVIVCLLILLSTAFYSFSQNDERFNKVNSNIVNAVKQQHLFSKFIEGKIYFENKTVLSSLLNYNILTNELQFIENNDTLEVSNLSNVEKVVANNFTLLNIGKKKGLALIIAQSPDNTKQLAVKKSLITRTAQSGGFTVRNPEDVTVDIAIIGKVDYYLFNNNKATEANRKNFGKLFSNNKNDIEIYIKNNNIDFENEESIKQLFNYCISL
mgnify:CR=1 FL=1